MDKGAKIGLIIGGVVLVGAVGVGIYYATRDKVTTSSGGGNNTGGNTGTGGNSGGGININFDKIKDLAGQVIALTEEKFPMRVGMKGQKVKDLQSALKNKFGQDVKTDGVFGTKTWTALKKIGYVSYINSSLGQESYNKILEGVKIDNLSASGRKGADFGSSTVISL